MNKLIATQARLEDVTKIARHYGYPHQLIKTIEELNELIVELSFPSSQEKIISELADVIIMTTQLVSFFGTETINLDINYKLDRQLLRMEAENNG